MPTLTIPEDTYRRLAARAEALHVTVEQLVVPVLEREADVATPSRPLTEEVWRREIEAHRREVESRADRYPPGFRVDDSREAIYAERLDAQM